MPNVVCKKCGAEAISKCPYCRSVFPEDQHDSLMSYLLKFDIKTVNEVDWLEVSWFMGNGSERRNAAWGLNKLKEALNGLDLEKYCCDHEWVFKPGEHSRIDCGHG